MAAGDIIRRKSNAFNGKRRCLDSYHNAGGSLTGCKITYSHDFVKDQTFLDDEGTWVTNGFNYSFTTDGLIIDDMSMSAPISFKGDFECTFEFEIELPETDTDYVDFVLFMIDGDANSIGHRAGISTEYFDLPTARHAIGQGPDNNIWDKRSWGPDNMVDGVNEFTLTREGDFFSVLVNGANAWTFMIDSANLSEYYRPFLFVKHTGFTAAAGFYLKSVKVKYEKGNSI